MKLASSFNLIMKEDFDTLIQFSSIIIPTNNKHKFLYAFCY